MHSDCCCYGDQLPLDRSRGRDLLRKSQSNHGLCPVVRTSPVGTPLMRACMDHLLPVLEQKKATAHCRLARRVRTDLLAPEARFTPATPPLTRTPPLSGTGADIASALLARTRVQRASTGRNGINRKVYHPFFPNTQKIKINDILTTALFTL